MEKKMQDDKDVKIYNNLAIRPIFLPVDFENEPMWRIEMTDRFNRYL